MSFSPEWLALREPADHRSRNAEVAATLARYFAGTSDTKVVDLGCGTGSNLRATSLLLGPVQHWTLVDYDPALLAAARVRLSEWADVAASDADTLVLTKGARRLHVAFRQADLVKHLDAALGSTPDLVTASALFDLCSPGFIETFAAAVATRKTAFFTVLTYNGEQSWSPKHALDEAARLAFNAHQKTDKGFGVSAGPDAPAVMAAAFRRLGYAVHEGESPWVLQGRHDAGLVGELAQGFAGAVAETGHVDAAALANWRAITRAGAVVGHTDSLALPTG